MKKVIKQLTAIILQQCGKRLVNFDAPAKPYADGIRFLKKIIDTPGLIIDIGVADGTPELTDSFPLTSNRYLLIEANPKFHHNLESLVQISNGLTTLEKSFCGATFETISFNLNKTGHNSSKYSKLGTTEKIEVLCKPLDAIIDEQTLADISPVLLKIDVEGAELDVLQGATKTLERCDVVIMETWINVPNINTPATFATLVSFMDEHGFSVFDFFAGCNHASGVLAHVDTVFVKKDSKYRTRLS